MEFMYINYQKIFKDYIVALTMFILFALSKISEYKILYTK